MIGVGAVLGFFSGLFGVGGSSIATPILRLLDIPRLVALATPLPVTLPTAIVGGLTYWRRGMVNKRVALWTVAGGLPTVVIGSYLSAVLPGRLLMLMTAVFVLFVGARLLRDLPPQGVGAIEREIPAWIIFGAGAGVGFLSGLLANGGGFLLVPIFLLLFRMGAHETSATSLVSVGILALPGTWVHWKLGHIDPRLALALAAGVIPFTWLGARAGIALPELKARRLFGWFLLVFGAYFLLRTLHRAEIYGLA